MKVNPEYCEIEIIRVDSPISIKLMKKNWSYWYNKAFRTLRFKKGRIGEVVL